MITLNIGITTDDLRAQRQARVLAPVAPAAALATLPVWKQPPPPPMPKMSLERAAMLNLPIPVAQDVTDEVLGTKKRTARQNAERVLEASDSIGALAECSTNADATAASGIAQARRYREALARRLLLQCVNDSSVAVQCGMEFEEVQALKERLGLL